MARLKLAKLRSWCCCFKRTTEEAEVAAEGEACCRICFLEMDNSSRMMLDCSCKGDLALAHRECVIRWFSTRRDNKCDVCNAPVSNLPPLLPRDPSRDYLPEILELRQQLGHQLDELELSRSHPAVSDRQRLSDMLLQVDRLLYFAGELLRYQEITRDM